MTMVATVAFVAVFALNVQVSFDAQGITNDVTTQDLQVQKVLAGEGGAYCSCSGTVCPSGFDQKNGSGNQAGSCCGENTGHTGQNLMCR